MVEFKSNHCANARRRTNDGDPHIHTKPTVGYGGTTIASSVPCKKTLLAVLPVIVRLSQGRRKNATALD